MRHRLGTFVVGVVLLSVVPACAPAQPPIPEPVRCEAPIPDPAGFEHRATYADDVGSHLSVRRGLSDGRGAELHLFAGVAGEFGEGLDAQGTASLADGGLARLVGGGRTWILVWDAPQPCTPRAVLGSGMGRARFLEVLCDVALLSHDGGRC